MGRGGLGLALTQNTCLQNTKYLRLALYETNAWSTYFLWKKNYTFPVYPAPLNAFKRKTGMAYNLLYYSVIF